MCVFIERGCVVLKRSLIFAVFLSCSVMQSAERVHLLADVDALESNIKRGFKRALDSQTSVWVMVVRNGKRYTGLYDLRGENNQWGWTMPSCRYASSMVMPVMDALKNEALRGYEQRRFSGPQKDFSKELECVGGALDQVRYKRCVFFSQSIRRFLTLWCSKLQKKGKVSWDHCGKRMTDDVLQSLEPSADEFLRFFIQDKRDAVDEVLAAKEGDPIKVFMTLSNLGVVKGCLVSRQHGALEEETLCSPGCFLFHKVCAITDRMVERYPYNEEKWKRCLNYDGDDGGVKE